MECAVCHKEIKVSVEKKIVGKWTPKGVKFDCPHCGSTLFLRKRVTDPKRNRPKHLSKKARLSARKAEKATAAPKITETPKIVEVHDGE